MRALLEHPLWHKAMADRSWQRFFGRLSGICLAIALLTLADGLIAQMRTPTNHLELLPGTSLTISGPTALKNPLKGDVRAQFVPLDAPLAFELEGFFTGYWFGSGMWRGQVTASPEAAEGTYELRIAFKGAGAQNSQKYIFAVYPDSAGMRAASHSFVKRFLDLNPFVLAVLFGGTGFLLGIITFYFGRSLANNLHDIGLVQIYSGDGRKIWCLVPPSLIPKMGSSRMILDENGHVLCEARAESYARGKLGLSLLDQDYVPEHSLVCLRHPGTSE